MSLVHAGGGVVNVGCAGGVDSVARRRQDAGHHAGRVECQHVDGNHLDLLSEDRGLGLLRGLAERRRESDEKLITAGQQIEDCRTIRQKIG